MSTIYVYIEHNLKGQLSPVTLKASGEMKFNDLILTLYNHNQKFRDYDFIIKYNENIIPLTSTKTLKEYGIKYYSRLKLKITVDKKEEEKKRKKDLLRKNFKKAKRIKK